MKRGLAIILTAISLFTVFAACDLFGPELKINVPEEPMQAELGSYDLPEFQVVNRHNAVEAGYEVVVKKVTDPNGNTVRVSYNRINAVAPGTYTVTYGVKNGEVDDAELKISFAANSAAPAVHMKEDALPKYYIQGIKYSLPVYTLSGAPDYDLCYIKIYYLEAFDGEKAEVEIVNNSFKVEYNVGFYQILIHTEDADGNFKEYTFYIEAVDSSKVNPGISHLPEYGETLNLTDCGKENYMQLIEWATEESFAEYCSLLTENGFTRISSRSAAGNLFATFTFENKYVYVYYTAYNGEMRVATGPVQSLVLEDYSVDTEETVTPYIASIPQSGQGEGYIFRLPDGRFIIQDGGYDGQDRVYSTLRKLIGDEPIVIAAWFISHPHDDHYPAFIDFIRNYADDSDVTIERVIYNYGNTNIYMDTVNDVLELYSNMERYAPDVPLLKAHTGQLIDFGSATVEILYTVEDLLPQTLTNVNDSSMVIRIATEDNSVMLLNDTCYESGPILHNLWGDHLKSDIVQIAHHGMWPSVASIYHDIAGEVVLFPNLYGNLKSYLKDPRWSEVIDVALSYARDISVSGNEMVVITLPYVFEDNKAEEVDYILNYR